MKEKMDRFRKTFQSEGEPTKSFQNKQDLRDEVVKSSEPEEQLWAVDSVKEVF